MSGIASTVPVMSRRAYSLPSAGARPEPAAQITAPTASSCAMNSSLVSFARQPGIDSSLSSVPPVCPRPRPESCGTATPNDATSGASGSVILSPTPPVECLSVVVFFRPGEVERLAGGDHRLREVADLVALHAADEDRHRHRGHLLVADVAAGVGVDQPVDLRGGERAAVALGVDQVDDVERLDAIRTPPPGTRSSVRGPNASGMHLVDRLDARHGLEQHALGRVLEEQLAAASARHERVAVPVDAGERDELAAAASCAAPTPGRTRRTGSGRTTRSRRSRRRCTRPSSTIAATPTGKFEYGTYAWVSASFARRRAEHPSRSRWTWFSSAT